jgi:hypothetical protein
VYYPEFFSIDEFHKQTDSPWSRFEASAVAQLLSRSFLDYVVCIQPCHMDRRVRALASQHLTDLLFTSTHAAIEKRASADSSPSSSRNLINPTD